MSVSILFICTYSRRRSLRAGLADSTNGIHFILDISSLGTVVTLVDNYSNQDEVQGKCGDTMSSDRMHSLSYALKQRFHSTDSPHIP